MGADLCGQTRGKSFIVQLLIVCAKFVFAVGAEEKKDWELANEAVAAAAAAESNVDAGDWAAQGHTSTITKHLEGK